MGPTMYSYTLAKVFALTMLVAIALPVGAQAVDVNIVSGSNWTAFDSNMTPLGNAENVCLNATTPSNCPVAAAPPPTLYGYPLVGWTADLSSIPGAKWIWAPNISGATSPAANATFTFQTEFYLCGTPTGGAIWVAGDNTAEVLLNGQSVLTATDHSKLKSANISNNPPDIPLSSIKQGLNIIQVKGTNGPNPTDCGSDEYQCNPAGVVFGASFKDALPDWPTCKGRDNMQHPVGTTEPAPCPGAGETGGEELCVCLTANFTTWIPVGACHAPQCTDSGKSYKLGDLQPRACPLGMRGSATRKCVAEGTWGPIDYSGCVPRAPLATCIGIGGAVYGIGMTETLPCAPGQVGAPTPSHTCTARGWGVISGTCTLPTVCPGCQCGAVDTGITGLCPAGTSCAARRIDRTLVTADWYCDPP
jgi:hypothetical protein